MTAQPAPQTWTVLTILQWTAAFFKKHGVGSPRLDAELLLAHVLGVERIQLYVQYDRPLTEAERGAYRAVVARRGRGEPVQYLVGSQEFWSLPFVVRPGVLIPRADTEVLVEEVLAYARDRGNPAGAGWRIADVGSGSGALGVALASELPEATVVAGDIAPVPLELTAHNAHEAGVAARLSVHQADGLAELWAQAGRRPFDVVVSNPPYIRAGDHPGLMREVRDHEPIEALVSGVDGLDLIRRIVADATAPHVLTTAAALVIEIGDAAQAQTLSTLCLEAGFATARVRDDYAGRARAVVARRASDGQDAVAPLVKTG